MISFSATIGIIGVNPFVIPPERVLNSLFFEADRDKGPIPVFGQLNGHQFTQTIVKYASIWRLYINTPMLKSAKVAVGDTVEIKIKYDPIERVTPMHPKLKIALDQNNKAKAVFDKFSASRQREIMRYINFLKTEKSVEKNIKRCIQFLLGKERFVGRAPS
jgi:hypothetical protein